MEWGSPEINSDSTPSHQRPEGVLGEWQLAEGPFTIHQKVADVTGGWVTAANVISIVGAAITAKGLYDFTQGNEVKGLAEIGAGRVLDLVDGVVAKRTGTRSKTGALIGAGADKFLVAGACVALPIAGVMSKGYAAATLVQQGRIFAANASIEKAGGEPNPSRAGKYGMFATWAAITSRVAERIFQQNSRERSAELAGGLALATEYASLTLAEKAIAGYKKQK